uniref:Uncharacterized protein n=1 Tax=Sphaerodactylus townsendi TaxID=933632 RepID=A0ACB8G4D8_9SAUR
MGNRKRRLSSPNAIGQSKKKQSKIANYLQERPIIETVHGNRFAVLEELQQHREDNGLNESFTPPFHGAESNTTKPDALLSDLISSQAILISKTLELLLDNFNKIGAKLEFLDKLSQTMEQFSMQLLSIGSKLNTYFKDQKSSCPFWHNSQSLVLQREQIALYIGDSSLNANRWGSHYSIRQSLSSLLQCKPGGLHLSKFESLPKVGHYRRLALTFTQSKTPNRLLQIKEHLQKKYDILVVRMFKDSVMNKLIGRESKNIVPKLSLPIQGLVKDWNQLVSQLSLINSSLPQTGTEERMGDNQPITTGILNRQQRKESPKKTSQDRGGLILDENELTIDTPVLATLTPATLARAAPLHETLNQKQQQLSKPLSKNVAYEWEVDPKPMEALYPSWTQNNSRKSWAHELLELSWTDSPQTAQQVRVPPPSPTSTTKRPGKPWTITEAIIEFGSSEVSKKDKELPEVHEAFNKDKDLPLIQQAASNIPPHNDVAMDSNTEDTCNLYGASMGNITPRTLSLPARTSLNNSNRNGCVVHHIDEEIGKLNSTD